ncbi:MAG: restriction endonuclease subunit S [Candidatus Thiodiazotropha sp.]
MSWPIVKLGEIFDIARGGSPRPIQNYITEDPEGLNWIMIGDTKGDSKYIERVAKKIKREGLGKTRQVQPGDFLLTNSMSFGRPYILKTSGCIHDGWLVLHPKSDNLYTDYFYYCLSSDAVYQKLSAKAAGAVVKNLNTAIVKELEVPLPPLPIQKQIAALLEKADTLRSQCKQMEQELNQLAQSVFLEMFGDPVTNPKGWVQTPCKELCRQITVGIVVKPSSYYVNEGVPALRSLNVRENRINDDNWVYFDSVLNETKLQKTRVYKGDVVIVRSGQPGTAAVIPPEFDGVNAIDILIARPNAEQLNSLYLSTFLNSVGGKRLVLSNERGQIQKHLNVGELGKALIPTPPIDKQAEYEIVFSEIEKAKLVNGEKLKRAEEQFNSLMQTAFNGKLNLTKAA